MSRTVRAILDDYPALPLALAFFLLAWPLVPGFAGSRNLSNMIAAAMPLFVVALGQTIVLIAAGIDLSLTATIAASSVTAAWLMNGPVGIPGAVMAALVIGILIGVLNGAAVAWLRLPPFLVTLATLLVVGGGTLWATRSRNVGDLPESFTQLGWGRIAGVPWSVPLVATLALAAHVLMARTLYGRWLSALGHNPRASRVSGVPVRAVTVGAYAAAGLCAAIAGLLYTARLETGSPTMGREILLDVIGAAVIGGASLSGGRGSVLGTFFGVLLFVQLDNALSLLGVGYEVVMTLKGVVILVAATADRLRVRATAGAVA